MNHCKTRQSHPIPRPTNHTRVMSANWRPCFIYWWQFYCHQVGWCNSLVLAPNLTCNRPLNNCKLSPAVRQLLSTRIHSICQSIIRVDTIKDGPKSSEYVVSYYKKCSGNVHGHINRIISIDISMSRPYVRTIHIIWTYILRPGQNGRHFKFHFLEWKCLNSDESFTEVCS